MKNRFRFTLTAAAAAAVLTLALPTSSSASEFDGVTVNILTITGPTISGPMQRRAPEFKELTGADINVITVPVRRHLSQADGGLGLRHELDRRSRLRAAMGSGLHHARLPSRPDGLGPKRMTICKLMTSPPFFNEILATVRRQDISHHGRRRLPDGLLPVRRSRQAGPLRARDLGRLRRLSPRPRMVWIINGDGEPDFGSCIAKKRNAQSYWMISSVASGLSPGQGNPPKARILRPP